MISIPPVLTQQPQQSQQSNQTQQNVIPLDIASKIAEEASEKAALKAISTLRETSQPTVQPLNDLNIMDKKGVTISYQDYERLRREASERIGNDGYQTIDLGRRFNQALSDKINDQLIGKMVDNLLGGSHSAPQRTGTAGLIMDILNSQFAYGAGQSMGASAADIIKTIGKEKVGQFIDAYSGNTGQSSNNGQQPQELSPEERQKKIEATMMGLDSNNSQHVNEFMQVTKINNYEEARQTILNEQSRILQSRGLSIPSVKEEQSQDNPKIHKSREQPTDMNRQLINQYDNPDIPNRNPDIPPRRDAFFDNNQPTGAGTPLRVNMGGIVDNGQSAPFGINQPYSQQAPSESEFILSLNPDDPISQQQYMAYRGITGIPLDEVKRLLIKEQRKFRDSLGKPIQEPIIVQPEQQPKTESQPIVTQEQTTEQSKREVPGWKEDTIGKIPDKLPSEQVQIQPEQPQAQSEQPQLQLENLHPQVQPIQPQNNELSSIVNMLQTLGANFDSNMQLMSEKINYLEREISQLKSKELIGSMKDVPIEITSYNDIAKEEDNKNEDEFVQTEVEIPENKNLIVTDQTKSLDNVESLVHQEFERELHEIYKDDDVKSEEQLQENKDNIQPQESKYEIQSEIKPKKKFSIKSKHIEQPENKGSD